MDKALLADATSADDSPTPGYMLNEISRGTIANYQACLQLIEYLNSRLKKNNHNIKYKVLVIVKHVCRTGRADFKKEMARNLNEIKECLQYKGPPDPLRGDEIYRRVRDAAKEALDAIFDSQMPVTTSAVATSNRITGMGGGEEAPHASSSSTSSGFSFAGLTLRGSSGSEDVGYQGHPGATGSFAPRSSASFQSHPHANPEVSQSMAGIGNPNFPDAREDKSWVQKIAEIAESTTASFRTSDAPGLPPVRPNDEFQYRSNRGPSQGPAYEPNKSGGMVDIPASAAGSVGRAGTAASDGQYEYALVAGLCEPGGMKPVPPEDKLAHFLNAAPTLSAEFVGASLLDHLNSDAYQSRTKALIVIASLAKARGCLAHAEWWIREGREELQGMCSDSKASVRTQALKTLRALKMQAPDGSSFDDTSGPATTQGQRLSVRQTEAPSLLDMDDNTHAEQQPPDVSTQQNHGVIASSSASAGVAGLFDGMSVGSKPVAADAPPNHVSSSNHSSSVFDFLDGSSASSPPPPPPQSHADLFGDMIVDAAPSTPSRSPRYEFSDLEPVLGVHSEPNMLPHHMQAPQQAMHPSQQSMYQQQYATQGGLRLTGHYALPHQQQYQQPHIGHGPVARQVPASGPVAYHSSMGSPAAPRKVIPDSTSSGFSFLGDNSKKPNTGDTFSFVTDAMKASTRK